ncbi:MAG: hypothetical protein NC131_16410 [Roseburia sp.]|nr:hypothetical protein [Roseburia sp.]
MIKIDLQNVQAVSSATLEIPENSITEFSGDNSNGKSILSKVIQALTSGDIRHKDVRRTLIKDGTTKGVVSIVNDHIQLGIILSEELSDSFVVYDPDIRDNDKSKIIVRGLGDSGGCEALIKRFGFRTYASGDICLQVHPTWGPIPFITTSGQVNDQIVQDITIDRVAQNFLDSFKTITFPTFKNTMKTLNREKETIETIIGNLESYDWKRYDDIYTRMKEVYNVLFYFVDVDIPDLSIPLMEIPPLPPDVPNLRVVCIFPAPPEIPVVLRTFDEYVTILNGTCPTCGKKFVEDM